MQFRNPPRGRCNGSTWRECRTGNTAGLTSTQPRTRRPPGTGLGRCKSRSISRAAFAPGAAITPPPGWVPELHIYMPLIGARYCARAVPSANQRHVYVQFRNPSWGRCNGSTWRECRTGNTAGLTSTQPRTRRPPGTGLGRCKSRSISRAAFAPGAAITPPPGWVPELHIYMPLIGARYCA